MINLIQPITVQQAYDGITHARRWASWNWWWRMVDDDDGDGFPSPEPRTDSRSALPRGFRAWRRLRIVKRDEIFSPFFSPRKQIYRVGVGVGRSPGGPQGRGHALGGAPASWPPRALVRVDFPSELSIFSKNKLGPFLSHLDSVWYGYSVKPKTCNRQELALGTGSIC